MEKITNVEMPKTTTKRQRVLENLTREIEKGEERDISLLNKMNITVTGTATSVAIIILGYALGNNISAEATYIGLAFAVLTLGLELVRLGNYKKLSTNKKTKEFLTLDEEVEF